MYLGELLGTSVFAITGVLAVSRRGLDVFGAIALGLVTALAGGTVRDSLIEAPIFWFADFNYVWAAIAGAIAAFWIGTFFRSTYRLLLYLDALGAALFAIGAANKVLLLGLSGPIAVLMGILTGIGGGLVRDVLAGRPTLLVSREIYATPILIGCTLFVLLQPPSALSGYAGLVGFAAVFGLRAAAIWRGWQMPAWLTEREDRAHDPSDSRET